MPNAPENDDRLYELFQEVVELDQPACAAFLKGIGDDALRRRLQELIAADEACGAFLSEQPVVGATSPTHELPGFLSGGSDGARIGRYEIERELGRGGQATVYLAMDRHLGRPVAIKILTGLRAIAEGAVARFRREAEVASSIDHPGICTVHDAAVEDDVPYIVMRFVEGESLAHRLSDVRRALERGEERQLLVTPDVASGPESSESEAVSASSASSSVPGSSHIAQITACIEKCARALHACHEAGFIHRDIKPGNIMITPSGDPVILDFGLAHLLDADTPTLTGKGDFLGTPHYMSSEQVSGGEIPLDRRTDVYSLGVVLFECLTLERPFKAPTRAALHRSILTGSIPVARKVNQGIPRDLQTVLDAALATDRRQRYDTAEAMADDLRAIIEHRPVSVSPTPWPVRTVRWAQRHPAVAMMLLAIVISAGLGGYLVARWPDIQRGRSESQRQHVADLLEQGFFGLHEKAHARAEQLFRDVLLARPESPEAVAGLALAALQGDDPARCLQLLDTNRPTLDLFPALEFIRVQALEEAGEQDAAQTLRQSLPEPVTGLDHFLLGSLELSKVERNHVASEQLALEHFRKAVLLSRSPTALFASQWAHAAGHCKDREAALESAELLRVNWSSSPMTWFWIGYALRAVDPERALAATRRARALRNSGPLSLESVCLIHAGRFKEALSSCREVLRTQPDSLLMHEVEVDALQSMGCNAEAIALAMPLILRWPGSVRLKSILAQAQVGAGRIDEAVSGLVVALKEHPDSASLRDNQGLALRKMGRVDAAMEAYRGAIALGERQGSSRRELTGRALINLSVMLEEHKGAYDEALQLARRAIKLLPGEATAWLACGVALLGMGKHKEALPLMERAFELSPELNAIRHHLGTVLCELQRYPEAFDILEEGLRREPADTRMRTQLAITYRRSGQPAEALREFEEVMHRRPDSGTAHNCALVLSDLREFEKARSWVRRAMDLVPNGAGLHILMADLYLQEGRHELAIKWYRDAMRLGANGPYTLERLASASAQLKRWEDLEAWTRKFLAKRPNDSRKWFNLGLALENQGRLREAAESLRISLQFRESFNPRLLLARIYDSLQRWSEAATCWRQLVEQKPTEAWLGERLALCLLKKGETEAASAAYRIAESLEGHSKEANALLAEAFMSADHLEEVVLVRRTLLALESDSAECKLHLAEALCNAGQLGESLALLKDLNDLADDRAGLEGAAARKLLFGAAICALRAADGRTKNHLDLDEKQRSDARSQAAKWLVRLLQLHEGETLDWQRHRDLAPYRPGGARLEACSEVDRQAWLELWKAVQRRKD